MLSSVQQRLVEERTDWIYWLLASGYKAGMQVEVLSVGKAG